MRSGAASGSASSSLSRAASSGGSGSGGPQHDVGAGERYAALAMRLVRLARRAYQRASDSGGGDGGGGCVVPSDVDTPEEGVTFEALWGVIQV